MQAYTTQHTHTHTHTLSLSLSLSLSLTHTHTHTQDLGVGEEAGDDAAPDTTNAMHAKRIQRVVVPESVLQRDPEIAHGPYECM